MRYKLFVSALLSLLFIKGVCAQDKLYLKVLDEKDGKVLNAMVWDENSNLFYDVDKNGLFSIKTEGQDSLLLTIYCETYSSLTQWFPCMRQDTILVKLVPLQLELETFTMKSSNGQDELMQKLNNVRGMGLFAGKKTELLNLVNHIGNKASNNAREIFATVPGLNIWENDASGLQLNIGARGLDPNRTAHFNTRQNGYDISADALGYPETYYTPPVQALKQIEIVRGAASLQFGPQFGGMLNFILKDEQKQAFSVESVNSVSSNNLFSTYNAIGGTKGLWSYYAFGFYKRGDGYRPNSGFEQGMGYGKIAYKKNRFKWHLEHTSMTYLAQTPGGLVDFEFENTPFISKRNRNWFNVNWNLSALQLDYAFSPRTRMQSRSFLLGAFRRSVGELGPINRPDPLRDRDLIVGEYNNLGSEFRFLHQYDFRGSLNTILTGFRYYRGNTFNRQGFANASSEASFDFLNAEEPQVSSYRFPGRNAAFFVENIFNFSDRLYVSPGMRLEHIKTAADGYFYNRVYAGLQLLFEEKIEKMETSPRFFPLFGMGVSYKLGETKKKELYVNASQNFRSINFTDISISNPNIIVDQELTDEKGYNVEFGFRGRSDNSFYVFDANLFYLSYENRIGLTTIAGDNNEILTYRTNVGDARVVGVESFQQLNLTDLIFMDDDGFSNVFVNVAYQRGAYIKAAPAIQGNQLEKIPPLSIRSGFNIGYKGFKLSALYSYVSRQYTDATNAVFVSDATRGIIPSYQVMDISLSKKYKFLEISAGVNNVFNEIYFTQRAVSYPGPGIMTAAPRTFHASVGIKF